MTLIPSEATVLIRIISFCKSEDDEYMRSHLSIPPGKVEDSPTLKKVI
jgi:hypothetical protein